MVSSGENKLALMVDSNSVSALAGKGVLWLTGMHSISDYRKRKKENICTYNIWAHNKWHFN